MSALAELIDGLADATARALESLEDLVPDLSAAYQSALQISGRRMARDFRAKAQSLTADATFIPPDEDEVVNSTKTKAEMDEASNDAQADAAQKVADAFEAEGISFEVDQVFTQDMLDAIGERAAFAADEGLRDVYRGVIVDAGEEGWSVSRTAEEIVSRVDDLSIGRAEALARTDLNGLANGASVHVATVSKNPEEHLYKNWLATDDDATRDSHLEADGQSVLVNDSFIVGGAALTYPGDPFGPPEEVMNCRCTITYSSQPGGKGITAAVGQPTGGVPSGRASEEETMETVSDTTTTPEVITADGEAEGRLAPIPWDSTLAVEGETTEDLRLLEHGSIRWRDLPLTLMGTLETTYGHMGAKVTGRIDSIQRVGSNIDADGDFTSTFGIKEVAPLVEDRTVRGVSVDLAVFDYEYRDPDTGEALSDEEVFERWWFGEPMVFVVLDGVIIAATVCPMPAIANTEIAISASAGLVPTITKEQRAIIAAAIKEGEYEKVSPADVKIISVFTPFDRSLRQNPMIASAGVVNFKTEAPPRAHFELTEFPGKTPLTVTDDGRVFGHIATWDTCHVGIPGVCTTAPRSPSDYAYFHTGSYPVEEGGTVDVGKLMLGTGHATLQASREAATRHYDKPDKVGAYVRAIDGEHGIWVSGVVRPELTSAGLRELRANPPSGDWRRAGGALELIAVCAVAVPGFPVARASAKANIVASGDLLDVDALIASAGTILPTAVVKEALIAAGCGCEDMATADEVLDDLADLAD